MAYTNKLHVIYGDGALGVAGDDFHYIFSYERGGLESLKIKGRNGSTGCRPQPSGGLRPITTGERF